MREQAAAKQIVTEAPTVDRDDRRVRPDSNGLAFVYVLPCVQDEILKLGFSRNPLQRMRAFSARYFDFFDLDEAFLIETDRVKDARRIEQSLGRQLSDHRAPSPLQVPRRAAGHTEWYRGALSLLHKAGGSLAAELGYAMHRPLRTWWRTRLESEQALLFDWSLQQWRVLAAVSEAGDVELARRVGRVLENALDEFSTAGIVVAEKVCAPVLDWYCGERSRHHVD